MKIICILFYFGFSIICHSQECDNIILNDGTEINAVVKDVSATEITYKKCDFQEGPIYKLKTTTVFLIKYKNEEKDIFSNELAESQSTKNESNLSMVFDTYFTVEMLPIDGKCLHFFHKSGSFYGEIQKFKKISVYYYNCNGKDRFRNYIMKSSIVKIEDENGVVLYTRNY